MISSATPRRATAAPTSWAPGTASSSPAPAIASWRTAPTTAKARASASSRATSTRVSIAPRATAAAPKSTSTVPSRRPSISSEPLPPRRVVARPLAFTHPRHNLVDTTRRHHGETLMTAWSKAFRCACALSLAILALVLGATSRAHAATECPNPNTPADARDLQVDQTCKIGTGSYYYADVNVLAGGKLWFQDEPDVHFWAKSIIVENEGALLAGTDEHGNLVAGTTPIGTKQGWITIHLWGEKPANRTDVVKGATCKSNNSATNPPCGIPKTEVWDTNGSKKIDLPGGVHDYFYQYENLPKDDSYFGAKVLGVTYGGTVKLFGKRGATYCPDGAVECLKEIPTWDSGTSWGRLVGTIPASAGQCPKSVPASDNCLKLDRKVDWRPKDRIVVTTTDYLPGHSELLEVQSVTSDGLTVFFEKCQDPECAKVGGNV